MPSDASDGQMSALSPFQLDYSWTHPVLLVPLLLCLHRRRRLPCLGNALRHVRFTDNTLATRRAKTAEAGVTMPASTVEGRRDEGAAPAAAEATTQERAASV